MLVKAPKGTKDLLPKDIYKWHYIEKEFKKICDIYGFDEMRTPVFEHTELFIRGVGDTTDIVQKEMYSWEQGKRNLTLRPEGTASIIRSVIENKLYALPMPLKIYYDISCFRYEKPQTGRQRQFHQFGVEVLGADTPLADSEIISLANSFLNNLGIKNLKLEINSVGCPKCKPDHRRALKEFLSSRYEELCDTCKDRYEKNPMRILDCKNETCQKLVENAPEMYDYLCDECRDDFESLKANLRAEGISYEVNSKIVRGLDYYTKTAFEFTTDTIGAQGTVCGGGRYNNLSEELDGPQMSGVGFGMGKERLLLVMQASKVKIPLEEHRDIIVAYMGEKAKLKAIDIVSELRRKQIKASLDVCERGLKGQLKFADRSNVRYTIIIGEDELEKGVCILRDMKNSAQREIELNLENIEKEIRG